jgi:hypothetical protein
MGLAVFPVSFVQIAIGMNQPPLAVNPIIFPEAFVCRPISPKLHTLAESLFQGVPLTCINRIILHPNWAAIYQLGVGRLAAHLIAWAKESSITLMFLVILSLE